MAGEPAETVRVSGEAPKLTSEMEKRTAADSPPAGAGFKTVTLVVPPDATRLAGTVALPWMLLKKLELRAWPFQRATEVGTKFEPLMIRLRSLPTADADVGVIEVSEGSGLLT